MSNKRFPWKPFPFTKRGHMKRMEYNVLTTQPLGNGPTMTGSHDNCCRRPFRHLCRLQYTPVSTFCDKDVAVFVNAKKKKNSLLVHWPVTSTCLWVCLFGTLWGGSAWAFWVKLILPQFGITHLCSSPSEGDILSIICLFTLVGFFFFFTDLKVKKQWGATIFL